MMRVMRGTFLDYSRADFVTTARAKGMDENAIMFRHVLRNAINPVVTSFGFAFAGLLSGALLVENVMNYPGLGQLIYAAIIKQDQYVVMAGVVIGCAMLVAGQLIADILLALADPRIRLEREKIPAKGIARFHCLRRCGHSRPHVGVRDIPRVLRISQNRLFLGGNGRAPRYSL